METDGQLRKFYVNESITLDYQPQDRDFSTT
jgi:hypothetical protein